MELHAGVVLQLRKCDSATAGPTMAAVIERKVVVMRLVTLRRDMARSEIEIGPAVAEDVVMRRAG